MKTIRLSSFFTALVAVSLLAGCGSSGIGDVFGNGRSSDRDSRYNLASDVRGTVERVDTRDRYIVVDREDDYRNDLRNGDDRDRDDYLGGDEVVLYYDDATTVEHDGQSYRPQDLEPGDRIAAEVQRTGDRLMVEDIDVLYDASSGVADNRRVRRPAHRGRAGHRALRRHPRPYLGDRVHAVGQRLLHRAPGRSYGDTVLVHYDTQTLVEFEGRRFGPENIERGDVVEVEVRDLGQRLLAEEIRVVRDSRSVTRLGGPPRIRAGE